MLKNTDPEKYIFTNLTWSKDLKKNIKRGMVDSAIPCPSRQLFGSGFWPKSGSKHLLRSPEERLEDIPFSFQTALTSQLFTDRQLHLYNI